MAHESVPDLIRSVVRRLAVSLGITLAFVVIEIIAGLAANSLALMTDAAHNFTDVLALALSWWALRLATRPAHSGRTYGYHRAGILVALANSTTLALIALGIFYEAWRRFVTPPEIKANILIIVGFAAVVVNLVTALLIRRGSEGDLNLRSAFLHLMGDVLSTAGAAAAGIAIRVTGWNWLDPLVSVFIGLLILWNAWGIVRESVHILMEATPTDIDMEALVHDIQSVPGVLGVHDLHVWSITRSLRSLSAHIVINDVTLSCGAEVQAAIGKMLEERYQVTHATLQLECRSSHSTLMYCNYR